MKYLNLLMLYVKVKDLLINNRKLIYHHKYIFNTTPMTSSETAPARNLNLLKCLKYDIS